MQNRYRMTDEEDPQIMAGLTPGSSEQVTPPPAPPPTKFIQEDGKNYEFTPGPGGALVARQPMPTPTPIVPSTPVAKSMRMPGMPPNMPIDELETYLGRQKSQLAKFGPQQRLDVQNNLNARQNSLGVKATDGLKGFADALMMGVARAGNPNWQGQFQQGEQKFANDQIAAFKDASHLNTQQVESGMSLDKMNPGSELSKTMQKAYAPLFAKMGYPTSSLNGMSAANIDSAVTLMAQFGGAEMQALIKQYEAEIASGQRQSQADETKRHNLEMEELQKTGAQKDAATEILKRSGNAKFLGVPIPFTSDVSGPEEDAAKKTLMAQIQQPTDFNYDSIKSGDTYVGPDGKTRIKK